MFPFIPRKRETHKQFDPHPFPGQSREVVHVYWFLSSPNHGFSFRFQFPFFVRFPRKKWFQFRNAVLVFGFSFGLREGLGVFLPLLTKGCSVHGLRSSREIKIRMQAVKRLVAKIQGDKLLLSARKRVVVKLQGDKSASKSSTKLHYPWISGTLRVS